MMDTLLMTEPLPPRTTHTPLGQRNRGQSTVHLDGLRAFRTGLDLTEQRRTLLLDPALCPLPLQPRSRPHALSSSRKRKRQKGPITGRR